MKVPAWVRRTARVPATPPTIFYVPVPPGPSAPEPVVLVPAPAASSTASPRRRPAPGRAPTPKRPASAAQRWQALADQVRAHRAAYYIGGHLAITDGEFDALVADLLALEAEHPELRAPDSPTQPVGAPAPRRAPRRRPGRRVAPGSALGRGYAVLDVETTGYSPAREKVVEIAVVHVDPTGRIGQTWSSLIHPGRGTIPAATTAVHGITIEDVRHAPRFEHIAAELVEQLDGRVIVAHNAAFDLGFLRQELARAGIAMPEVTSLCTMEASRDHLPHLAKRRLSNCCDAAGINLKDAHSAAGDARATAALLRYYLTCPTGAKAAPGYADLVTEAASTGWPPPSARLTARSAAPRTDAAHRSRPAAAGRLADLIDRLPRSAAVGAPALQTATYRDLLTRALSGPVLTDGQVDELASVATATSLIRSAALDVHRAVFAELVNTAMQGGKITHTERATLAAQAGALALGKWALSTALTAAAEQRTTRLSANLRQPPPGWAHGPTLHVGDRVAFTGGDGAQRALLERAATDAGLRVTSTVTGKTAALITNDATTGTAKARAALALGTRIIEPATFATLLDHLQPPTSATPRRAQPETPPQPEPAVPRPKAATTPTAAHPDPQQVPPALVRAWAREHGIPVSDRGRLPASVIERYRRETSPKHH